MTYDQLLRALLMLDDEQLDQSVTILMEGEYLVPVCKLLIAEEDDVLDQGHPYLSCEE